MAVEIKNKLLKKLLENDKKVKLVNANEDFYVELSSTSAKMFSKVMQKEIEESDEVSTSFDVSDFKKEDIESFVKYLQGEVFESYSYASSSDAIEVDNYIERWESIVSLIKLSHKFDIQDYKTHLFSVGQELITKDNVFEALALMGIYSFEHWKLKCSAVLQNNLDLLEDEKCSEILKSHTHIAALTFFSLARQMKTFIKEINPIKGDSMEKGKSEGLIKFEVRKISEYDGNRIYSEKCYIRNLPWKVSINECHKADYSNKSVKYASIFVYCNPDEENSNWSCQVNVEITLKRVQCSNESDRSKHSQVTFNTTKKSQGYSTFITWDPGKPASTTARGKIQELMNKSNGYITDNDSIRIEVQIKAEIPVII